MNPLGVLMWKHLVGRKRRYILTTAEILSPLAFFVLLYLFKGYITASTKSRLSDEFTVQNTEPVELKNLPGPTAVFYSPDTDLTGLLMDQVGESLHLKRNKYTPGYLEESGYMPFKNLSDVLYANRKLTDTDAIVLFENMTGSWPERLNYTIKMKGDFQTHKVTVNDESLGPHESFGTIYEPFMKLQWAIDTSYLKLLTGTDIKQRVTIQEFPYVRQREVPVIKEICNLLPFLCWISLILTFVYVMSKLLEERITGIQELIKMVGVTSFQINVSHFLNMLPIGVIFCVFGTVVLTATSSPIIPQTNPFLITTFLLLHFVNVMCMAYGSNYIVTSTQYSTTIAALVYLLADFPTTLIGKSAPKWALPVVGLLPFMPTYWFWWEVGEMEAYGKGAGFGSIGKVHDVQSGSILAAFALMLAQSVIYLLLGWYLSLVNPGPYGQPLPANFLCTSEFWTKKQVVPEMDTEEETELAERQDPAYFETPPKDMYPGIRIVNVSKVFPKHRALNKVSLDVYRGEITVLLGHNGAGKTTLMSIITGMMSATEGKVYVEGFDSSSQKSQMRKLLGLCPQHNLFFPDLTIQEHVIFFTMLKGSSYQEAKQSSAKLLKQLGLGEKMDANSSDLSGGMKRRLQLACALAGDAAVLILDEPTSGLDIETRRELWDLLLSLRGSRTVLLSTHFMEEADALGDRVAALHSGRLVCYATTMHLKKAIGTGYRLSVITVDVPREASITSLITSHVPDATLKEQTLNSLSYNLPSKDTSRFPKLFNSLESKKSELGINFIGVGISTLEEVFLKLCSDTSAGLTLDEVDMGPSEPQYELISGVKLYARQIVALVTRQLKYMNARRNIFATVGVILPLCMITLMTITLNSKQKTEKKDDIVNLNLDLYPQPHRRVLMNVEPGTNVRALGDSYPDVDFELTSDVADAVFRTSKKDVFEYNKYLVGIELNETHANALYTTVVRHAAPVSLSLLSNTLAGRLVAGADGRLLATHNEPLQEDKPAAIIEPKPSQNAMLWGIIISVIVLTTSANYMSLTCNERASGTRHLHVLSGCSVQLHWFSTLLCHATLCILTLALPAALAALLDDDKTIDEPDFMGFIFFLYVCALLSFLSFTYFLSLFFKENAANIVTMVCIILFGFFTPTLKTATDALQQNLDSFWDYLLLLVSFTMPPHATVRGGIKAAEDARVNAMCKLNRPGGCKLQGHLNVTDYDKCCVQNIDPRCYMCFDKTAPLSECIVLLGQFVFYMSLVLIFENGIFSKLKEKIFNSSYRPTSSSSTRMVAAEKQYVDKAIALPQRDIPDAVLVSNIYKRYFSCVCKPFEAVKGLSFSVKRGECFGLLGVNGAGKSTTFRMLAGIEYPSKGQILVNGHFMSRSNTKYLHSLGYCPQFFGLDSFLSGHDNIALLLTLKGLDQEDVDKEVDSWIRIVGLERYALQAVSGYSGGCARRLSAAASLCGGAPVALLDEPTAGVDVAARRRVWAALRRAAPNRAIIITSHSMDEMEALCSRIGIMVGGRLRALGSAAELRATHAAGHAVRLKLTSPIPTGETDETDSTISDIARLKGRLHDMFECTLKDEHKTMLHYHINETLRYSELFSQLEQLKKDFPSLVEDYDITETTLEEVFLTLAREQEETYEARV
ncbi:unnamed protein product [Danaus chrysippus]|uniref:(African queen) hypothetical protein n=1 Tax=Danaus chrysippus TaxID=151541 RepID=A0A8J2VYT5_9NEOP|nr:unnamed protein product [Danaus chrysippus]